MIYQALAGMPDDSVDSAMNRSRLIADERIREELSSRRITRLTHQVAEAEHQLRRARAQLDDLSAEASRSRDRQADIGDRLREVRRGTDPHPLRGRGAIGLHPAPRLRSNWPAPAPRLRSNWPCARIEAEEHLARACAEAEEHLARPPRPRNTWPAPAPRPRSTWPAPAPRPISCVPAWSISRIIS